MTHVEHYSLRFFHTVWIAEIIVPITSGLSERYFRDGSFVRFGIRIFFNETERYIKASMAIMCRTKIQINLKLIAARAFFPI